MRVSGPVGFHAIPQYTADQEANVGAHAAANSHTATVRIAHAANISNSSTRGNFSAVHYSANCTNYSSTDYAAAIQNPDH
jgi:hypothetical protein